MKQAKVLEATGAAAKDWLLPKIKPPFVNLACPIQWNTLYVISFGRIKLAKDIPQVRLKEDETTFKGLGSFFLFAAETLLDLFSFTVCARDPGLF